MSSRIRNTLLTLALGGAVALLVAVVSAHYPIQRWLFWRYLAYWVLALGWAASCLGFGAWLLDRLRVASGSMTSHAALAFPLGVFAFQTAMFVLGLAGLLGKVNFILLPVAFALPGLAHLRQFALAIRGWQPPRTVFQLGVLLFGIGGLGLIYFQILSPEAFHWDARWYHLTIAQNYAIDGAVRPFREGFWLDGQPHSASLIYAWAFSLPGSLLFDRLELCAHLEMVVFMATIVSIPTLVRSLAPEVTSRGSWAAIFLFPGIFLYDSNLSCGADHIAALWCIPVALSLMRVWVSWKTGDGLIFGAFMAAGLASKFSAWSMLFLPGLLFVGRAAQLIGASLFQRGKTARRSWQPLVVAGIAMLLLSGQHWLRNLIWYGDPVYPILHGHLHDHPWSGETSSSYELFKTFTFSPRPNLQGLIDAAQAMFTFSFIPNDWPVFHRNVPVFGFLFTLSMFALPFVRREARLWMTYLGVMAAIVFWYLTSHQDRYLQAWLPAMVACTVATFGLVWQKRDVLMRGLVALLVGLQIIWGSDVPFFPTHNLIHDSPIRLVSNFIASGFLQDSNRLRPYHDEAPVHEVLPPDARLLVHELQNSVGFGAHVVVDQWQGLISYAELGSPGAIYAKLRDLDITHIVWHDEMSGWNSVGHDLAFLNFALNHTPDQMRLGHLTLARFPRVPPPTTYNDRVLILGCGSPYPPGIYRIAKLTTPNPGQAWAHPEEPMDAPATAVQKVGFVVQDPSCFPALPPGMDGAFHPPATRGPWKLFVRRL